MIGGEGHFSSIGGGFGVRYREERLRSDGDAASPTPAKHFSVSSKCSECETRDIETRPRTNDRERGRDCENPRRIHLDAS